MASELSRIKKRKETKKDIDRLSEKSDQVLLIHYSCESFYDIKDGRTPRVTSIAVRNLKSAQTESFSIHKIAERNGVAVEDIPTNYDELEKEMLTDFFEFVKYRQTFYFVHWNMRDGNYGFSAIEHRFQALVSLFGRQYVGHGSSGRFHELLRLNKMTDNDALTGKEEADAFDAGEYIKLHQSTLRKVDCMSHIFERIDDGSIATNATWQDKYGMHPKILVEYIKDHWLWSIVIIAILLGLIGKLIGLF
jgi:hypothetical protein